MSRPLQIALLVTVVFAGVWFAALRPRSDEGGAPPPAVTAPGTGGLGAATDAARTAADQADTAAGRTTTETGAAVPPAAPQPAATRPTGGVDALEPARGCLPGRVGPVRRAIERRRVVVLIFWNRRSPDDRAARAAVARLDRRGDEVTVASDLPRRVGCYNLITRSIAVLQTPTILVVDRSRKVKVIEGFTDAREVDQAVRDALTTGV